MNSTELMDTGTDINSRKDIEVLVGNFYDKVQADSLLAPQFSNIDWEKHLPVMYNFWSSMMLSEQSYNGNPFQKHMKLPIGPEHFDAWLQLFIQTVDEQFKGVKADEIKFRARAIAGVFQHKMNHLKHNF